MPLNPEPTPFTTPDPHLACQHFAPKVEHIAEDEVEHLNGDPEILRVNAARAVEAIKAHLEKAKTKLPDLAVHEILELPTLGLALGYAAARVFAPASPQEIRARQERLRPARSLGLRQLEILAEMGLVPAGDVRNIRANKGPVDEANDAVAIVGVFREHEKDIAGKHPFDAAWLRAAAHRDHPFRGIVIARFAAS